MKLANALTFLILSLFAGAVIAENALGRGSSSILDLRPFVAPEFGGSRGLEAQKKTADISVHSSIQSFEYDLPYQVVDRVVVRKRERVMLLMDQDRPVRVYPVALGDSPVGHKRFEGDERTPEGVYTLDWRNPRSRFYKSIHISYPNEKDRAYAESLGYSPGGMIMIHGWPAPDPSRYPLERLTQTDWTDGCIAVSNDAMDEIWHLVPDGTPIHIYP